MTFNFTDSYFIFILMGATLSLLGLVLVLFGVFAWLKKGDRVSDRMKQFVTADNQPIDNPIKTRIMLREISGSLFSRTVVSWAEKFIQVLEKLTPKKLASEIEHKLEIAGNPGNLNAGKIFALRFMGLFIGIFIAFLFNRDIKNISLISAGLGIFVAIAGFLFPVVWLNGKVRSRKDDIRRELPNALDILSVCADAGLGFDQSIQKVSMYWESALGNEFKRVTQELEMGVSRGDALKNMSNRLDVDDLSRFVSIIVQAEMIGMSYADVLHAQAIQMRVLRQYWAREIANKLPAKMIIPLAVFIFPALIAVILGPTIPTILNFL